MNLFGIPPQVKAELEDYKAENFELKSKLEALSSSLAIIEFSPSGEIINANTAFLNTMDYQENEIIGKHHKIFCTPETIKSSAYANFWSALARGDTNSGQFIRLTKGGQEIWLEASYCPVKDDTGRIIKVVKIAFDITDRVQQSNEQKSQLEAVHKSMAVIEFTPSGEVITCNENFTKSMGYQHAEVIGKHHRTFCDPEHAQSQEYKQHWEKLNKGEFVSGRFQRRDKHGQEKWLEASYNPIFDHTGKLYKIVKFASDITASVENAHKTNETAIESSKQTDSISQRGISVAAQANSAMQNITKGLSQASDNITA